MTAVKLMSTKDNSISRFNVCEEFKEIPQQKQSLKVLFFGSLQKPLATSNSITLELAMKHFNAL